jgi:hypothetical protein
MAKLPSCQHQAEVSSACVISGGLGFVGLMQLRSLSPGACGFGNAGRITIRTDDLGNLWTSAIPSG